MQRAVEGRRASEGGFYRRYPTRGPAVLLKLLERVTQPADVAPFSGRVACARKLIPTSQNTWLPP